MPDYLLVLSFLIYLIVEGFLSGRKVSSINSFSLGLRAFSTTALTATITATWVSGSGFVLDINQFYAEGITYFIASLGMCATLSIIALWIVPKMERFLGKTSVASIMGKEYGQTVRCITGILGVIKMGGGIYVQFKIMGTVIHYMFPIISYFWCVLFSCAFVTFYTAWGGVNSVVHTDKIQAICFLLSLVIGIVMLNTTIKLQPYTESIISNSRFTIGHLSTLTSAQWLDMVLLTLYFLIPGMSPTTVQRISMGITIKHVQKAYLYSSAGLVIVLILSCGLSWLVYQVNPLVTPGEVLPTLLDMFTMPGTKGILVIGIISMAMSTADSNLNIAAVLLANDTYKSNELNKLEKLNAARYATIVIGFSSLIFAFQKGSLLSIILFSASFYIPIVTIPLLSIIFNYKTTELCVLIAMGFSFCFVVIFKFLVPINFDINSLGMLLNLIVLVTSHYLIEKWELFKCFGIKSQLKKVK